MLEGSKKSAACGETSDASRVIMLKIVSGRLPAPSPAESEIVRIKLLHGDTTWLRADGESEEEFIERAEVDAIKTIAAQPIMLIAHTAGAIG